MHGVTRRMRWLNVRNWDASKVGANDGKWALPAKRLLVASVARRMTEMGGLPSFDSYGEGIDVGWWGNANHRKQRSQEISVTLTTWSDSLA
jgi:hypothetical protein